MGTSAKIIFFAFLQFVLSSIYIHSLSAQLVSDFRVNDDSTNRTQYAAKIGVDSLGNFTVVWQDQRNNRPNVYCQRLDPGGHFRGNNFRINSIPDSSGRPSIAVTISGTISICWLEINSTIPNSSKIKFRIFSNEGIPTTAEILLNDTLGNFTGSPSIGVNNNCEFFIAWNQNGVLYQKVDSNSNKIGNNIKVNDNIVFAGQGDPAITVRTDGSYIITWHDTRPPASSNADDIYFQAFDRLGNRIGMNQKVNDDISTSNQQRFPKISSDTNNKFIIAWSDNRDNVNSTQFYAQSYWANLNKEGNNFRLHSSSNEIGALQLIKRVDGKYLIGWDEEVGSVSTLYFQRYDTSNIRIGNNILVSSQSLSSGKIYSDIEIYKNRIISVWNDERNDPFDIYCNIRSFTNPDTTVNIIQTSSLIPENFLMHQNYPNPFNSSTIIEFEIKQSDNYKLEIVNSLGQVIQILFQRNFYYGTYQFNLDATNLSSGMYYSILSSKKERIVKSFVILK